MDPQPIPVAVAYVAAGAGAIALPLVAFLLLRRRYGLRGRVFLVGAATFFVFQGLLRLPWLPAFNQWSQARLGVAATLLLASLTAALWEETGRYVAYRFVVRRPAGADAVAMGLGHGGFESAVLVGGGMLVFGLTLMALPAVQAAGGLPAEVQAQLEQAGRVAVASGVTGPLLALVERVGALTLHVGLSILVAAARVRRRASLWLAAVAVHFAVNAAAVALAQAGHTVLAEGAVILLAAAFLAASRRWLPVLDGAAAVAGEAATGAGGSAP